MSKTRCVLVKARLVREPLSFLSSRVPHLKPSHHTQHFVLSAQASKGQKGWTPWSMEHVSSPYFGKQIQCLLLNVHIGSLFHQQVPRPGSRMLHSLESQGNEWTTQYLLSTCTLSTGRGWLGSRSCLEISQGVVRGWQKRTRR